MVATSHSGAVDAKGNHTIAHVHSDVWHEFRQIAVDGGWSLADTLWVLLVAYGVGGLGMPPAASQTKQGRTGRIPLARSGTQTKELSGVKPLVWHAYRVTAVTERRSHAGMLERLVKTWRKEKNGNLKG